MFHHFKKATLALALGTATTVAGLSYAQIQEPATDTAHPVIQVAQNTHSVAQDTWLSLHQIYDKLEAAGYVDIREIEREDGGYEAKARDAEGRAVKLHIEPLEGRIVKEKIRNGSTKDKGRNRQRSDKAGRQADRERQRSDIPLKGHDLAAVQTAGYVLHAV